MPSIEGKPQTLYDKVLQAHIVDSRLDGTLLLYIDRHLVHEVTSPVSTLRIEQKLEAFSDMQIASF